MGLDPLERAKRRPVVVIGAGGFIGSHVMDALRSARFPVLGADAKNGDPLAWMHCDLTDFPLLLRMLRGSVPRGIINLAGMSRMRDGVHHPRQTMEANVQGVVNLLEAARLGYADGEPVRIQPWVILGSTREVGRGLPTGAYGTSKLMAEMAARCYARDFGLRVLALRLSDVYGSERDNPTRVLPALLRKCLRGEDIVLNDACQLHDFTHYSDVCRAMVKGARWLDRQKTPVFHAVPIVTGKPTSLLRLSQVIAKATRFTGNTTARIHSKDPKAIGAGPLAAQALLGFTARVSLEKGIRQMLPRTRR